MTSGARFAPGCLGRRIGFPAIYIVTRYIMQGSASPDSAMKKKLNPVDYKSLAELRHQIRRFLHFSEQAARNLGLEPRQHQLMLAIKGLPDGVRPRIGEFAERLQIQHHSAVELVNRLSRGGYVRRLRGSRGSAGGARGPDSER